MPDIVMSDDDRRLNLDQQRRRAKELREAAANGAPEAIARLRAHHPKAAHLAPVDMAAQLARLADAQLVIARELGMPSWPKLKAHIEGLDRARSDIAASAPAPDADRRTLHIRCGSDIRIKLQQAGFQGAFLEVSDPICLGPVPRDGDLLAARSGFLAETFGLAPADATARLTAEYAALAAVAEQAERIALWFEHDSYDQLLLARVLASLAGQRPVATELICLDHYPGLTRYIGLGQLSPAALRTVWSNRTRVGAAQYRLGAAVWAALRDPDPNALHAIALGGTPEIPAMAGALRRHLQELPWVGDGLSLTQRLALQALRHGVRTVSDIFSTLQLDTEPLPFIGDTAFCAVLRELETSALQADPATADGPWPQRRLSLMPTGEALLARRADWMAIAPAARWVGGVQIVPGRPHWRWDGERECPAVGA
jgi:hypothetical protein